MVKENMSIEEMRHEQQLVDRKIKEIINDLGYKRFRGEKIDEKYERDCEIRIRKLKQDSNEWSSEVQKKEQAYEEEKYSAAHRYMLSIPFVDEDDYIPLGDIIARYSTSKAITPDLLIEEPDNSLSMGDEHLDTTLSIENLVPIPLNRSYCSNFTGIVERFDPNDESSSDAMIVRTSSTDIKKMTKIKTKPDKTEYGIEKCARKRVQGYHAMIICDKKIVRIPLDDETLTIRSNRSDGYASIVATYRLRLPEELSGVHDTFHVSTLKKCLADASLHVPLNEIKVDKTLRFIEEPVEILDREIKSLKRSKISLVKVRWDSKRGPEFTWEREDFMKSKYPQLFVDRADESAN
ncbi:hypothetical protein Tco_0169092 [Tanacetum coccineum]